MVKKNILDSKPTANKKCDLISIPKKTSDAASGVRSARPGGVGCPGLVLPEAPASPGPLQVLSPLDRQGSAVITGTICRNYLDHMAFTGRDWGQEEKAMTEDEMAGWHH